MSKGLLCSPRVHISGYLVGWVVGWLVSWLVKERSGVNPPLNWSWPVNE